MKMMNGHKAILAGLAFVVGVIFSGCGAPECDNEVVLDWLRKSSKDNGIPYDNVVMTDFVDKEAKKVICRAKVSPEFDMFVKYEVQVTQDGQKLYMKFLGVE